MFVILSHGPRHRLVQRVLVVGTAGNSASPRRFVAHRNPGPLGQQAFRFRESHSLPTHHELVTVAAQIADPTLPSLTFRIDLQTRARVLVPRTQPGIHPPRSPERDLFANQLDNVGHLTNAFFDFIYARKRHRRLLRLEAGERVRPRWPNRNEVRMRVKSHTSNASGSASRVPSLARASNYKDCSDPVNTTVLGPVISPVVKVVAVVPSTA